MVEEKEINQFQQGDIVRCTDDSIYAKTLTSYPKTGERVTIQHIHDEHISLEEYPSTHGNIARLWHHSSFQKTEPLKEQYEKICNEYIKIFCKKQNMSFEGWIGQSIGGTVRCSDGIQYYHFGFNSIVLDIDTDQPKGFIITRNLR